MVVKWDTVWFEDWDEDDDNLVRRQDLDTNETSAHLYPLRSSPQLYQEIGPSLGTPSPLTHPVGTDVATKLEGSEPQTMVLAITPARSHLERFDLAGLLGALPYEESVGNIAASFLLNIVLTSKNVV